MRCLNRTMYGNISARTKEAYVLLCTRQHEAVINPITSAFEAVSVASNDWNRLALIEERFFWQKSRIQWLRNGDQNTSFFHKVTQGRASKNAIKRLVIDSGVVVTDHNEIKKEAVSYYQRFL